MFTDAGDRTSQARIRDEALRLFGEHGPSAVTVRDVAAAAEVSPALVIRHYTSKDGLRAAVDDYVTRLFAALLEDVASTDTAGAFEPETLPSLAESLRQHLPRHSPVPRYLGWMLIGGAETGAELFAKLYTVSRQTLARMVDEGQATSGHDPAVRAAVLLVNDLAVLILRERLTEVLGVDPLSSDGIQRWGAEVLSIYSGGLTGGTIE